MELDVCARIRLVHRGGGAGCSLGRNKRMAREGACTKYFSVCGTPRSCYRLDDRWMAVSTRPMVELASHSESSHRAAFYGRRRRWSQGAIFSKFRSDGAQRTNSQPILHGVDRLPTLPRRYLQAVVQFDAPFLVLQQSM